MRNLNLKRLLILVLAASMLMNAVPVYAAESIPIESGEGEIQQAAGKKPEASQDEQENQAGTGEIQQDNTEDPESEDSVADDAQKGNTESSESEDSVVDDVQQGNMEDSVPEDSTAEKGTEQETSEVSNAIEEEISDQTGEQGETQRWSIQEDAFVHNWPGYDSIIKAQDEKDKGILGVGKARLLFFRLDLSEAEAGRKAESAKICLYKTDSNTNTVIYDRTDPKAEWKADNITAVNMPDWESEPAYKKNIAGKDCFIELDMTELVNNAIENGEQQLDIKMDLAAEAQYASWFQSSRWETEEQRPYFEVEYKPEISDEQKVQQAIQEIEKMDGMYLSQKVKFPFFEQHENGAAVAWESDSEALQTDGTVNQPKDRNAEVHLTATVSSGKESQSATITVTVLKQQSLSPYAKQSLSDLIEYTGKTLKGTQEAGDGEAAPAGTYSKEKGDVLREQMKKAEAALDSEMENTYTSYCTSIIAAGSEYFGSGRISDEVLVTSDANDGNGNLLEYSVYRAKLNSLVWAAKAQMLVEPQMYTKSAKAALQEQIELAEQALDGSYEFPYSRNREFMAARDDEAIQYVTDYHVMMHNYGTGDYGLEPVLTWYKNQNIAATSFMTMNLSPVYATFVHHYKGNLDDVYGNNPETLVVGKADNDRVALLQFDLSQIPENIVSSQLTITNCQNGGILCLNLEEDDWDGNAISARGYEEKYGQVYSKQQLSEFTIKGAGTPTVLDVTDAAVGQALNDGKISFSITASNVNFPVGIYGNNTNVQESYRPALTVTVAAVDDAKLQSKYDEVIGLADEFKKDAEAGESTGQYPPQYLDAVDGAVNHVKSLFESGEKDVYLLGTAMVQAVDAVRDARDNRILNLGDDENLFLSKEDMDSIKERAESLKELKEVKDTVMDTADLYDADTLQWLYDTVTSDDIQALNNKGFKVWSEGRNINFKSPEGTKQAYLEVRLSPENYEGSGIGHAWLDKIELVPTKSVNPAIPNAGFEDGETGWTFIKGENTSGKIDSTYAYEGEHSLYIENTAEGATGYWRSDPFAMEQDGFELRFRGKFDDKFTGKGLIMVLHYLDGAGNEIGQSDELGRNTKSALVLDTSYASGYQSCALAYMLTGDEKYAKCSFWYMMLFLDDHLQGVEYWVVNSSRPDDFDYYGAVQEGRNANTLATAYSLIKSADLFGGDEALEKDYYNKVKALLRDLLDLRDRTELPIDEVAVDSNNWHTDMSIGAAMLAMAFYDQIDNAQQYIDNGKYIVQGQLYTTVREDGSWPESIRYHISALNKMALFAKGLRHVTGEDWFSENSKVDISKMMRFLVEVQAPAYVNGEIGTPTIGDDTLSGGTLFSVLGWYWDEVVQNDPELGQQMYETWVKAGKPIGSFGSEDNILQNFFLNPDYEDEYDWVEDYELNLGSSDYAKEYGLYQLRNKYGTENETYLAFIANEKPIGHNHYDQLAFSMYYNSTPLVVDPGIESYFSSSKGTYISTGSHATVQFSDEKGYQNLGTSSYDRSFVPGDLMDQLKATTDFKENVTLTRTIAYAKSGADIFAVWDQINGADNPTRWNLPVSAQEINIIDKNRVDIKGFDGVGMTLLLLEGSSSIESEQIRGAGMLPVKDGNSSPLVDVIRAYGETPESNYLAVMIPYVGEAGTVAYEPAQPSTDGVSGYWIHVGEQHYLVAINNTDTEQSYDFGDMTCIQLSDGAKVEGSTAIQAGQMQLLKTEEKGGDNTGGDENKPGEDDNKPGEDDNNKPGDDENKSDSNDPDPGNDENKKEDNESNIKQKNTSSDNQKSTQNTTSGKNVKTGDNTSVMGIFIILALSGVTILIILIRKRKSGQQRSRE